MALPKIGRGAANRGKVAAPKGLKTGGKRVAPVVGQNGGGKALMGNKDSQNAPKGHDYEGGKAAKEGKKEDRFHVGSRTGGQHKRAISKHGDRHDGPHESLNPPDFTKC